MAKNEISAILTRIEIRMAELGMSKEEFYEKSGISSASFSQWNTGVHKPTKKKLGQAAAVLNVSLEYLLTGEQKEKPVNDNVDELSEDELDLIKLFRLVPEQDRDLVVEMVRVALRSKGLL